MDQIKQATEKFTQDITRMISEAAIASVTAALAPEGRSSIPAEEIFGLAHPTRALASSRGQSKPKTNGHAKPSGAKRDPAVIDKLTESLYAAVAKAPGSRCRAACARAEDDDEGSRAAGAAAAHDEARGDEGRQARDALLPSEEVIAMLDALVLWYVFFGLLLAVYSPWWRPAPIAREEPREEPRDERGVSYDEVFVPGDRVYVRLDKGTVTRGRIVAIAGPIDGSYRIVVQPRGCQSVVMADPEDVEPDEDEEKSDEPAVGYRESSKTDRDLN